MHLDVPRAVTRVVDEVAAAGGRALVVGGGVRDHLMGVPVKDWDVEVHGLDVDALERVLGRVGRVNTVGKAFSVFKVRHGGVEVDVALPRRDSRVGVGHRGILAVGDPHLGVVEAARRRDLTINAMMFDPRTGELIDPFGGRADLAAGVLRAVDGETFLEDPLRAVRVVQFAARFGFPAAPELVALCRAAPLDELPPERIVIEWVKLFVRGRSPGLGLRVAADTAITERLFPEVAAVDGPSLWRRLDGVVALRDRVDGEGRRFAMMLAAWLADVGEVEALLDRYHLVTWQGYPLRQRALAAIAARRAEPAAAALDARGVRWLATRAEVALVLGIAGGDGADVTAAWGRASEGGVLHEAEPRWVQGRDVLACGVRHGPEVGEWVERAYAAQLDRRVPDAEAARQWLAEAVAATR